MKKIGEIGIYIIASIVLIMCFIRICTGASQIISKLSNIEKRTKIENKEEMFQFVFDNREKLEEVVLDMEELYEKKDERIIIIRRLTRSEYKLETADELIKKYKLSYISVDRENELYEVKFSFEAAPKGYTYWGVYYTENGEPSTWGAENFVENEDIFTQEGSYYTYETEKIIDNWYYYQCDAG